MRVNFDDARTIIRDSVCSDCWGRLTEKPGSYDPATRTVELGCFTEGCEFHGYISGKTADRCEAKARADRAEAERALKSAAPWVKKFAPKSEKQILKELGF